MIPDRSLAIGPFPTRACHRWSLRVGLLAALCASCLPSPGRKTGGTGGAVGGGGGDGDEGGTAGKGGTGGKGGSAGKGGSGGSLVPDAEAPSDEPDAAGGTGGSVRPDAGGK